MSTMKPTIGRRVWFWPNGAHRLANDVALAIIDPAAPLDAGIVYVWGDGKLVNLDVADHYAQHHSATSVRLLQPGEEPPAVGFYATWMPYQVGQAQQRADVGQVGQQQEARS